MTETHETHRTPGSGLARFMELRGYRVVECAGAFWFQYKNGFYMSLPPHSLLSPPARELNEMLRCARAAGARYPTESGSGLPSGLYVCKPAAWSIDRKQRGKARRGLEHCEIRVATESELIDQGLALNLDTMTRQGRYDAEFGQQNRWERLVRAIGECPEMTAFGAFIGGRLAAYIIASREDGWLHLLYKMSRTEDLGGRSNYALDYWIIQEAAKDPALEAISNGTAALSRNEGGHEYKRRLGYQIAAHNLAIHLHPALGRVLANRFVVGAVGAVRRLRPRDTRVETAANVLSAAVLSRSR